MKKKKLHLEGVLFPCQFNSDGKAIRFSLHSPDGNIYFLLSDHLVTKMRKLKYRLVLIEGKIRKKLNETFIIVGSIESLEDEVASISPNATDLYVRDLRVFRAS